jgi:hypothetical protein
MNRFLLFIFLACTYTVSLSQKVYPYQDIKLEKPTDYAETKPLALSAATFLLTTAFVELDANRAAALEFLSNWVTGTKDPQFYMQGMVADISDDRNLLSLFIAAMVKYSLENKTEAANPMTIERNAAKLVLAYCDDPKNNFKLKKRYRKLLENNRPA